MVVYFNIFFLQPNTFQLVIAYDPLRYQTFMMYVYEKMSWDVFYYLRPSSIGYMSYVGNEEKSLQLAPSMKATAFRLHDQVGNTGECTVTVTVNTHWKADNIKVFLTHCAL